MSAFILSDRRIILDTDYDISLATSLAIEYQTPGGEKGEWAATLLGTDQLYADLTTTDANIVGCWRVQSRVELNGAVKYGEVNILEFKRPLDA